ncbi:MAG TPA: hypothetical protein VM307_03495 [Egibacteraceae bacterium]|nr:hypothetical protein [Egibacteraceae bacterium]
MARPAARNDERTVDVTDRTTRDHDTRDRRDEHEARDVRDDREVTRERHVADRRPTMTDGNGTAIASMVIGLLAATYAFTVAAAPAALIFGLIAIGLGISGMSKANALGGMHKGLAVTGLVSGALALLLSLLIAAGIVAAFNQAQTDPALQQQINELEQNIQQLTNG